MTRDKVQARIAQLEADREQALANANAFTGAIQDCEYWLGQIAEAEEREKQEQQAQPPAPKPKVRRRRKTQDGGPVNV